MINTYNSTCPKALKDAGAALRDSVRILVDDCSHGGGFETEMRDVLEASKLCLWCTRSWVQLGILILQMLRLY